MRPHTGAASLSVRIVFAAGFSLALTGVPTAAPAQQPSYEDELNNVLATYQSLRQELISSQEAYRLLKRDYASKTAELERKLQQPVTEKNVLQEEVRFVTDKIKECQFRATQLQGEREVLQEKYDALQVRSAQIEKTSAEYRQNIAGLEKENADLQSGISRLKEEIRLAEQKLTAFTAAAASKEKALDELVATYENQNRACRQQASALEAEKEQSAGQVDSLKARLEEKNMLIASLNRDIADRDASLSRLTKAQELSSSCGLELAEMREKKTALAAQVDALSSDKARMLDDLRAAQSKCDEKDAEIKALEAELSEERPAMALCKERLSSLQQEKELLNAQIEALRIKTQPVEDALREVSALKQQKDEAVASLKAELVFKENQIADLNRQGSDLRNRVSSLETELDRVQAAADEREQAVAELRRGLAAKEEDIDAVLAQKRALKEELTECKAQLKAALVENDAINEKFGRQSLSAEEERMALEQRQTDYQVRLELLDDEHRALIEERDGLMFSLRSTESSLVDATAKAQAQEKLITELNLSLDARTQALSDAQLELRRARRELEDYEGRKGLSEKKAIEDYVAQDMLKKQIQDLQKLVGERESELMSVKQELIEEKLFMKEYIAQQTDAFANDSVVLKEQLVAYQKQIVELTDEVNKMTALLAEKEKNISDLEAQVSVQGKDNDDLSSLWATLTDQFNALQKKCDAAEQQNIQLQADIDQLRLSGAERESEIKRALSEEQEKTALLLEENEKLLQEKDQLFVSISGQDEATANIADLLRSREQEITQLREENESLRVRMEAVHEELIRVEMEREDAVAKATDAQILTRKLEAQYEKNNALEQDNVALSTINSRLVSENRVLRERTARVRIR